MRSRNLGPSSDFFTPCQCPQKVRDREWGQLGIRGPSRSGAGDEADGEVEAFADKWGQKGPEKGVGEAS